MSGSRRFSVPFVALAVALVAFAPARVRAMHATGQPDLVPLHTTGAGVSFALGASVGLVEGTATELAIDYPKGKKTKLSELTWEVKDVVVAGLQGSLGVGRRLRLNLGVWSALTEGGGMMVDRDWIYPDNVTAAMEHDERTWSDESRHPDTSLDKGTIVDLNLSVMALRAGPFSLHGLVGYKHDTWQWSARGGTYVYSEGDYGARDTTGAFPAGDLVISYEQQYSVPYIGVGASWAWPSIRAEAHLLYSPLVSATDSDYHALRGVLFEGDFSGGTYLGLGLNATWAFTSHWSAMFGVEYQTIPEITGATTITGQEGFAFFEDGSGVAINATSVTLGAGYRF